MLGVFFVWDQRESLWAITEAGKLFSRLFTMSWKYDFINGPMQRQFFDFHQSQNNTFEKKMEKKYEKVKNGLVRTIKTLISYILPNSIFLGLLSILFWILFILLIIKIQDPGASEKMYFELQYLLILLMKKCKLVSTEISHLGLFIWMWIKTHFPLELLSHFLTYHEKKFYYKLQMKTRIFCKQFLFR